ncbi:efflux RND transporter periplasmic adaptor subunit [Pseudomonas sp. AOB-7]|uniref:efflux RND transporter periplasmic adaptor subunit n=1 Tax=Pseudomonas sp. AOB-7 TaxID=2482750 RepID=UPI000EFC4D22|nr:efflux RND transporter periplasmic adaptor subunit [Pseudomonas sp. AOB-7]RMH86599.1 efflux RND transporter periplasmic adaptor subunit [Pseudomonas sp. AOB-7]
MRTEPLSLPLILSLALVAGCHSQADTSAPALQPRNVLTTTAQAATSGTSLYTGVVAARTTSDLGFRVGGKVVERRVDPGSPVARGDVLLVLDNVDFQLALRAARNRVAAAQAELRQARDDEARYRRLSHTGAISRQRFEQAATRLRVAEAAHAAASSEAAQVENRQHYSTLIADADGVVTEVLADRGQVVGEGQVVVRLAHAGAREAVIDLPETQRVLASQPAQAIPYGQETPLPATLRELSASADPVTRTFRARYTLAGDNADLALGSTVTLHLGSAAQARQVRVPLGALLDKGQATGVWVIGADSRVTLRTVKVLRLGQEHALLEGDLAPGERIVALGAQLLNAGDSVRELATPSLAREH